MGFRTGKISETQLTAITSIVNIPTMADFQDEDGHLLILDRADKSVITNPIAPGALD